MTTNIYLAQLLGKERQNDFLQHAESRRRRSSASNGTRRAPWRIFHRSTRLADSGRVTGTTYKVA